jgi:hypothetical protein
VAGAVEVLARRVLGLVLVRAPRLQVDEQADRGDATDDRDDRPDEVERSQPSGR